MYIKNCISSSGRFAIISWVTLFWDVVNFVLHNWEGFKSPKTADQTKTELHYTFLLIGDWKLKWGLILTKCFDLIKLVVTWILVNDALRRTSNLSRKLLLKFLLCIYLKLLHWIKRGEFIVWVEKNADMLILGLTSFDFIFFWNFYSFILLDIKDYWMALKKVITFPLSITKVVTTNRIGKTVCWWRLLIDF